MPHNDPRTGPADSGRVTITDADDGAPQTVLQIPSDALFKPTEFKVEYDDDATNTGIDIEFHDNADGTAAGNVDDQRESFLNIDPDMKEETDGNYREFENDVLVLTSNGNQDGEIDVTVKGVMLKDLADMTY